MFDLMLMRHAKSDWHTQTSDIQRPLNKRGMHDASLMGKYLNEMGMVPDCLVVSGAKRTQQTANLILDSLPLSEKNVIIDKELYLADRETMQEIIEVYAVANKRLMLIAHNPGMDELVDYLASEPPQLSSSGKLMVTAAVACFQMESIDAVKKPGQGKLLRLLRPKEVFSDQF